MKLKSISESLPVQMKALTVASKLKGQLKTLTNSYKV